MISKFLNRIKEVASSASEVIPAMPLNEQVGALSKTVTLINGEFNTATKVVKVAIHQQAVTENKAKAIAIASKVGVFIGKRTHSVGSAIGTSARAAVEISKAISTPLVQGVKEGYSK